MGEAAALRVQTRFPTAEALLTVVGSALERGSLRLPLHLKFEIPFEVTLAAADGTEAIRGTAEVIEHAGHATWIRFLSAAPEVTDESARCMLADVDIDVTGPQEAVVEPAANAQSEAFEAITAVTGRPAALDAMPAGGAEPVPLLPPPPDCLFEPAPAAETKPAECADSIAAAVLTVQASSSEAMTSPIPVETMAQVIESRPISASLETPAEPRPQADRAGVIEAKVEHGDTARVVDQQPHEESDGTAVAVITEEAEAIYVNEKRDTEASPPIMLVHKKDLVARERGVKPLAEPYIRDSAPVIPQPTPRARRIMIAALSFGVVCLAVALGTIWWAHDAVAQARTKSVARDEAPAAAAVAEPAQPVQARMAPIVDTLEAAAPEAAPEAVPELAADATAKICKLDIEASVEDSRVSIDGKDRGLAPLSTSVPCGTEVNVAVRHPRYDAFERTITVTGQDSLRAKLERARTTVKLTSDPPAMVTLNGVAIGKTPMKTTVARFEQSTFRFSAPGFETDWRRIQPKSGTSTVILRLKPQH